MAPDTSTNAAGRRTGSKSALVTTWFVLGAVLGQDAEAAVELNNQLIGLGGLVALSAGTAVEAGMAVKKARVAD